MSKTLGQVAYEALDPTQRGWSADYGWSDLQKSEHALWQAAAEAVVDAASRGGPVGSPGAELADAIARERVIKVARAWCKRYRRGIRFCNGDERFAELIEALDSEEG